MTPHEVKLWNWLRETIAPARFHIRRQVPIDRFIVDFACLAGRIAIEVDGEQHGSEIGRARDAERDGRPAELGYRVLRFTNPEIDREKTAVLDTIYPALALSRQSQSSGRKPHPPPSAPPSPAGEGSPAERDTDGVGSP